MARLLCLAAVSALACASQAPQAANAEPRAAGKSAGPRALRTKPISGVNAQQVKKSWEAAVGGFGRAVAVSSALGRVAVASGKRLSLYDLTGKSIASFEPCAAPIRGGLAFHDAALFVTCQDGVHTLTGKGPPKAFPVNDAPITASQLAAGWLVLAHHDGVLRLYGTKDAKLREIEVPGPPVDVKSLALSPDGRRLAVAWVQGSIWWWDPEKPAEPHKLVRHESESDCLSFDASGAILAEEGADHTTTLWDLSSSPPKSRGVKNGDWVKRMQFSADGSWLVRGGSDGLELAELGGPRRIVLDGRGKVEDVALDETKSIIAAIDRDGRLSVWQAR